MPLPRHKGLDRGFVDILTPPPGSFRLAVKDMIAVAGCHQTAGLPHRAERRAARTAPAVERLRAAGASLVGTTVTDCAGFGTMTPEVPNPRHRTRAVGGSSGGAAAVVAAGRADVGLGTDTGGSVRIPAAYCDLYALKPSLGRTPMEGVLPLSPTFDVLGLIAARLYTLETAAAALVDGWRSVSAGEPRIAADGDAVAALDPPVAAAFDRIRDGLGAERTIAESATFDTASEAHSTIVCIEGLAAHRDDWRIHRSAFPALMADAFAFAEKLSEAEFAAAQETVRQFREAMETLFATNEIDVLISPTLAMAPASRHARTARIRGRPYPITNANIRLTLAASIAGLPVVVAPLDGLSVQFVGPMGGDEALLAHARILVERYRRYTRDATS